MKKMNAAFPYAACMALLVLVSVTGVAFADEADIAYRPPVQPYVAPPKDPAKVQRAAIRKAIRVENRHLAASVRKSLVKAGGIDTAHVSVLAKSGTITLAGTVPEVSQIDLAQQRARQVPGVTEVSNRLSLGSEGH
ncbi:BON domain-containing protein [Paraburkholderia strydomiana]|uniref:BON domain-containing protein n=1 Tax=Paraburkholderia strydomiana TaxID=1245417 RepID=UPI0038BB98EC